MGDQHAHQVADGAFFPLENTGKTPRGAKCGSGDTGYGWQLDATCNILQLIQDCPEYCPEVYDESSTRVWILGWIWADKETT